MSLRANAPAQHPVRTQAIYLVFRRQSHPQRLPKTQMQRTLIADGTTTFLRGRGGTISDPGSLHYGIRSQAWSQPRPQRWLSLPMQQITLRSCAPRRNDKSGRRNIWKEDNSSSFVDYLNWSALEMQVRMWKELPHSVMSFYSDFICHFWKENVLSWHASCTLLWILSGTCSYHCGLPLNWLLANELFLFFVFLYVFCTVLVSYGHG